MDDPGLRKLARVWVHALFQGLGLSIRNGVGASWVTEGAAVCEDGLARMVLV